MSQQDLKSQIDLDETARFLRVLGSDENTPINIRVFPEAKNATTARRAYPRMFNDVPFSAISSKLASANLNGCGVFFQVNKSDGKGQTTKNIIDGTCVVVDLDGPPIEVLDWLDVQPDVVVETSPGRYHAYYRVQGWEAKLWCKTQLQLAKFLGGDKSIKDLPRVMRLPGFFHNKDEPRLVRIIRQTENQQPIALAQLQRKIEIAAACKTYSEDHNCAKGNQNNTLFALGRKINKLHDNEEALLATLQSFNQEHLEPPLDITEVRSVANSAFSYRSNDADGVPITEDSLAAEFAEFATNRLLYNWDRKRWMTYLGGKWCADQKAIELAILREFREELYPPDAVDKAGQFGHSLLSRKSSMKNILELAQQRLGIREVEFDSNLDELNTPAGVLNLRDGTLTPHCPEQLHSKQTRSTECTEADRKFVLQAISDTFDGKHERIEFMQKLLGYAATGHTREQAVFIWHGAGANGKSALAEAIRHALAGYATKAEMRTFISRSNDGVRNDVAGLAGARLVVASEVDEGRKFAEALIKELTGGDTIKARFLHKEHFEFTPQATIVLTVNNLPRIDGNDDGIWRRMILIPFERNFADVPKDEAKDMLAEFKQRSGALLAWIIEGAKKWYAEGLERPAFIEREVQAYRQQVDRLGPFIESCCEVGDGLKVNGGHLHQSYVEFCKLHDERPMSRTVFAQQLNRIGFQTRPTYCSHLKKTARMVHGLALNDRGFAQAL